MFLRSVLIESFPFAPLNVSLPDEEVDRKKSDLVDDFLLHCPCARQLTSSELKTAQWTTAEGLNLQFWLWETDQMSLPLPSVGAPRRAVNACDCFANDVAAVRAELSDARRRFRWAVSPIRTIDELRDGSDLGDEVRTLRARVKSPRPLFVPGTPNQPTLSETRGHAFLPHGIPARMKAKVLALRKGVAVLQDVTLLDPISTDLVGAHFPRTIEMQRPRCQQDSTTCTTLMAAMDTGVIITLDVSVCLDWVAASPAFLELREVV